MRLWLTAKCVAWTTHRSAPVRGRSQGERQARLAYPLVSAMRTLLRTLLRPRTAALRPGRLSRRSLKKRLMEVVDLEQFRVMLERDDQRIANPRYSRLPVGATSWQPRQRFFLYQPPRGGGHALNKQPREQALHTGGHFVIRFPASRDARDGRMTDFFIPPGGKDIGPHIRIKCRYATKSFSYWLNRGLKPTATIKNRSAVEEFCHAPSRTRRVTKSAGRVAAEPLRQSDSAASVRSMDPRWGLIPEEMPTGPSASGAFDHSPQFQLRVRRPDAQFVPTGRLNFVVVRSLVCLRSHWFSRPCGTGVVGHPPPAVETAGYCQSVPAGQNTTSR